MSEAYSAPEPQDVVQQGQQLQAAAQSLSNAPIVNAAGENLQCQWLGCGERCVSPEALYEHVCERHVGRKSTNNLNLTCQWGQCRTTTVKRDHITSHIRVHVPLKPHKCEFCGKAFKRPQDLKKHVKTHADDSVIMRSPGPNDGQRISQQSGGMMYNEKTPQYYAQAMPAQEYGQHPGVNQYYQPQPQGQHPGYGPVSYYTGPQPQTYDYQRRKEGFDALDQFFGEVKRRQFDPINYQNVTRRLFELQGLQLPLITQQPVTSIPAYQPVSALGGGFDHADPIQSYSLPPMGNAKSREDLTSIDQILEQMQATIYENDTHLAQAGVSQPGAAYVGFHTGNSPTSATLSATHTHSAGMPRSHQNSMSGTDSASTPGLTPPSSAQSYTSGQSPMTGHAAPSSGAMYPNLPAGDMGYQGGNGATLGGAYDNEDPRRRYSGGMLQRAQPAKDDRSEGSVTPPAAAMNRKAATKGKKKGSPDESAIDPALSGDAGTPGSKGEVSKEEVERQTSWVENMRLIEWMREMIKKKLETAQFDENGVEIKANSNDVEMGGTDEDNKKDEERLYPVLEAVKAA